MTRSRKPAAPPATVALEQRLERIENVVAGQVLAAGGEKIENGALGDALGFGQTGLGGAPGIVPTGFPGNQGNPWSPQISRSETIFRNLRWYLVSNFRQMLSEAYVELGLVQTIVKVPVEDALRGGIEVKSLQLSPEEIEELLVSVDRDDDLGTMGEAGEWNRLFGGAGILILTDQDPIEPLDLGEIDENTPLEFRAADMWELTWDSQGADGWDPVSETEDAEYYSYYGERVHRSRVLKMVGIKAPSFIRPRLRGWGFSVVETLVRSINQYLKSNDLGFEVLDEFKVDVYKIKNLVNTLLSPQGKQKVQERIQLANWQKNYQNAIVMDTEDEWDHKQLSFAGLADAMKEIRMQVASDMRMPLTKLFGISATGFNSGEDDIEVYNSMVESSVRRPMKFHILRMLEIKCQKLFGFVPDDLSISFRPLRVLSSEQEENVKTLKFSRALQARQAMEISSDEFRDIMNKDELLGIKLEALPELEQDDSLSDDMEDEAGDGPQIEEKGDDPADGMSDEADDDAEPGADREPSMKSRAIGTSDRKKRAKKTAPLAKPAKEAKLANDDLSYDRKTTTLTKRSAGARVPTSQPSRVRTENRQGAAVFPANVRPWKSRARLLRSLNSGAFDKASYMADGGDGWIDPRRAHLFEDEPMGVDQELWRRGEEASRDALGEVRWQFVAWWYRKQGGEYRVA